MSIWNIYHKDGSILTDVNDEQVTIHGLEYQDAWMGECSVTVNIKNNSPIDFSIGDYIIYRGERFELNYAPGKQKQARKDSYGEAFVYDSVKFNSLQDELSRVEFLDVVLNDNELHYTALPKFSFYVQTIDDLLDRIQANLDEQIGVGKWKIFSRNKERSVQRGCTDAEWNVAYKEGTSNNVIETKSITIDTKKCWDALALVNSEWDINFIVRGRNVFVGTAGVRAKHIFRYGLGEGLYQVDQNADSDQSVITRLRAYGSEKNLPSHYYADLGVKYFSNIIKVSSADNEKYHYVDMLLDLDYIDIYFKVPHTYNSKGDINGFVVEVTFDFKTTITGHVSKSDEKCRFYSEPKTNNDDNGDEASVDSLNTFIGQVKSGEKKLYIVSGLNKKNVPSSIKEYTDNLPNNMAINRLMLPGFPHLSLKEFWDTLTDKEKAYVNPSDREHKFSEDKYRPYIDSLNIEKIGLRSDSKFFDNNDKTNGIVDIYPTIEEMEIGGVRVDEIYTGSSVEDDGRFEGEDAPTIDIFLNPAIDFDINDLRDDDFTIMMKDGMCGGRDFKVNACSKEEGKWRLTIDRVKDDALDLYFPYKDCQIKKGDHFVLTGINLPDSYVRAASLKLLKYAIALLDKNDYTRYVYQPKVDEIFMARQHDTAMADNTNTIKSLHDTLKAGDLMEFEDDDLNVKGQITIDNLTIKEEDGKIPTYEVVLREDKEVGTIQKIQQQISSLQSGNGGGSGVYVIGVNDSTPASDTNVYSARRTRLEFLSKLKDDTAQGLITFAKGIKLGAENLWQITKDGLARFSSLFVKGDTQLGENGTKTTFGDYHADSTGASIKVTEDGTSYMEADYITIRRAADFREITIRELRYIGGELAITPAAMQVSKVEKLDSNGTVIASDDATTEVAAYKCYFESEGTDGQKKLYQEFVPYDQARCQQWGIDEGTSERTKTKYYWRLVTAVGTDYIILSNKTYDKTFENSEPSVGDNIVQLGYQGSNRPNRQSAIILSATAHDAPSQKYYQGIHDFSLDGCVVKDEGYDVASGTFHTNVYGDSFTGDKDKNGYLQYDSRTKTMTFKGTAHFDSDSTKDGDEIASKKDLQNLNIKSGNLLLNTAFCGDYESIDVSGDMEVSEDKETFSDKLKYWNIENASIADSEECESGKVVILNGGSISQVMSQPLLAGGNYVLSFKGKGTTVTIEVGGNTLTQQMDTEMKRYELYFSCDDVTSKDFIVRGDNCTIGEIMLSYGTIAPAWSPSYSDNDKSLAEFQNLKFLTDAITEGSTTIDGGLVMSQQFRVGNYRDGRMTKETGGMSGYYNDDNSPFLWGGGSLEQAIYTIQKYKDNPAYQATDEEIANMAKFVVTHGGRAILNDIVLRGIIYAEGGVMKSVRSPNGNFSIDEQGNAKLKGEIEASKGKIGGFAINESSIGAALNIIKDKDGIEDIGYGKENGMTLLDEFIVFNGKNRKAILGQWQSSGTPILMRLIDEVDDDLTICGAEISIKNKKGKAAAMVFRGGYTAGLALKTDFLTSFNTAIKRGTNVALLQDINCNYTLPDMQSYDNGYMLMVKALNGGNKEDINIKLVAGNYTRLVYNEDNRKYEELTKSSFIVADRGDKVTELEIFNKFDAMILIFSSELKIGDDVGGWVQFKCPRDW